MIKLQGWARDGLTDEQIAHNMGVGYSTLQTWKEKYQDIRDSLKKGKEVVDFEVENALLQNALDGNVTAQIFWLKNRKKEQWRDKPENDASDGSDIIKGMQTLAEIIRQPVENRDIEDYE